MAWQERRHRWAMARGAAKWRLRRRLRYLWDDIDSDGIELLSAALSLSFAVVLAVRGHDSNALDHAYGFAALCATSATLKFAGVLWEVTVLRVAGLLLGTVFWVTIAGVFLLAIPGSISWLCFAVLALAQLWAVRRLTKGAR